MKPSDLMALIFLYCFLYFYLEVKTIKISNFISRIGPKPDVIIIEKIGFSQNLP